jgi:hypothetical protein
MIDDFRDGLVGILIFLGLATILLFLGYTIQHSIHPVREFGPGQTARIEESVVVKVRIPYPGNGPESYVGYARIPEGAVLAYVIDKE